jgi:hypothetical protein
MANYIVLASLKLSSSDSSNESLGKYIKRVCLHYAKKQMKVLMNNNCEL